MGLLSGYDPVERQVAFYQAQEELQATPLLASAVPIWWRRKASSETFDRSPKESWRGLALFQPVVESHGRGPGNTLAPAVTGI